MQIFLFIFTLLIGKHWLKESPLEEAKQVASDVAEDKPTDDCIICWEGYKPETARFKPQGCCHFYHRDCIKKWATYSNSCPLCNGQLTLQDRQDLDVVETVPPREGTDYGALMTIYDRQPGDVNTPGVDQRPREEIFFVPTSEFRSTVREHSDDDISHFLETHRQLIDW